MAAPGSALVEGRAENPHQLPTLDSVLAEDREASREQVPGTPPPPIRSWAEALTWGWRPSVDLSVSLPAPAGAVD